MNSSDEWAGDVGRTWAELYADTDRVMAGVTQPLLERIEAVPGRMVLDIGCGAGELSLGIARMRPPARVMGVDISPELVQAARARAADRASVEFEVGDAASWQRPGFTPDLLVSRHGVMFFADPVAAFAHLAGIAASDACLVFSCFRTPRDNPWASELAELLEVAPGAPRAPGPFAFADPQYVEELLTAAGWTGVDFAPLDTAFVAGMGDEPVEQALRFFSRVGVAAPVLRGLDGAARAAAETRIRRWLEQHRRDGMVAFGAAVWIVTARRARAE